ncbi:DUF512 domain-containing protein [Chloroflexia bacterium SDU3-3]|nr:DUF512 domain-containing protein [Chloroflexia bacterium SDU3-3]
MEYQPDLKNITGAGGTISEIEPDSIAEDLELAPGDILVSINGKQLRDVIDYRFLIAEENVELVVRRGDELMAFEIEKDADEELGVEFVEPLFDRLRTCNNKCPFCFLTQMPKGFRKSLYLKDDDYRLGFLYGNFVTLTNLKDEDWQRIEEQHLSPMYVSVHATDPTLRAIMLGKHDVPNVLDQIRRFGDLGVAVHTQIVSTPGVNDGPALHQSIRELAAMHPVVQSIAVVPVGLTKYRFTGKAPQTIRAAIHVHETPEWIDTNWEKQPLWDEAFEKQQGKPSASIPLVGSPAAPSVGDTLGYCARQIVSTDVAMRCYTREEAGQIIDLVGGYQRQFQAQYGLNLVYPSDEFYILAGREMPPADAYDDMPQYSNGVGMTRDFLDCWAKEQRKLPARMPKPSQLTLACGTLISPILQRVVDRLNAIENLSVRLLPVVNQFFGEMVTVSGLLTGQDVASALRESGSQRALLPRVMFDHTGKRTLDEYTLDQITQESGVPVAIAGEPDELVRYVRAMAKAV